MPAGRTYEPISSVTLSANTASVIVMSNIPSTYTDLILVANVYAKFTSTSAAGMNLRFNSDNTAVYSSTLMGGDGTNQTSFRITGQTFMEIAAIMAQNVTSITTFPPVIAHIMNYKNTGVFKTVLSRSNSEDGTNTTSRRVRAYAGLWRKTDAITSITLTTDATEYLTGSTFTLYGITAA